METVKTAFEWLALGLLDLFRVWNWLVEVMPMPAWARVNFFLASAFTLVMLGLARLTLRALLTTELGSALLSLLLFAILGFL